jgi:carbon monoxide dehydrogenase subunit G
VAAAIEAVAVVPAEPDAVFDYLARLDNHWQLMDGSVDVVELAGGAESGPDRAVVRMHGPLGIGRMAHTQVLAAERPSMLRGRAAIGRRRDGGRVTEGEVSWTLEPEGAGTRVRLSARVKRAGVGDRLILALGGRFWLRTRLRDALARLERLFEIQA